MARFYIDMDDCDQDKLGEEHANVEGARNAAIKLLGRKLQDDPDYAVRGHWRVDVLDADRRLLLHVIVATVPASPPLNWASFDDRGRPSDSKQAWLS